MKQNANMDWVVIEIQQSLDQVSGNGMIPLQDADDYESQSSICGAAETL